MMAAATASFPAGRVLWLSAVALLVSAMPSAAETSFEFQGTATSADPNLFGLAAGDPFAIAGSYDESLLTGDEEPETLPAWSPPPLRGPLPSDLEPRARLVLERQLAVAHRIGEKLTVNGRHQRYTRAVRNTAHPDVPIYLDLQA